MTPDANLCPICGAPLTPGAACRYCGYQTPEAAAVAAAALPAELAAVCERIRARQADAPGLMAYLNDSFKALVPGAVSADKPLFGGKLRKVVARLDSTQYTFALSGPACVVTRESVAGGMKVGMSDTLPAGTWPETLAWDLGRHAEHAGLGWRAVPQYFR